jgi:hypothetical protein
MNCTHRTPWLLAALFLMGACAAEVGDIDRTQANRLAKAQFAGLWYATATVIDVPAPSAVSFSGEQSGLSFGGTAKVIWDLQEKYAIAYPVSETVKDSEMEWHQRQIRNYWNPDDAEHAFIQVYTGQPVAVFAIQSHFDVKRQYNAQTGEQYNVIEENTTDRKWWEREFVRVDWSQNLIKDIMFITGSHPATPVNYYVQESDLDNPNRPTFTPDYMDVVQKFFVEPDAPEACSVYTAEPWDCVGAVVTIRHAFRKVDVNNDYLPWSYHNNEQQELFGFFLTEHHTYSEEFGLSYEGKVNLIERWNIWQRTRGDGDPVMDAASGTAKACFYKSDCDLAAGEFCLQDQWFTPGTCITRSLLRVKDRQTRPIVYHLSPNWPERYLREAYETADNWDDTFRDTVSWMRLWDAQGGPDGLLDLRRCELDSDCNASAILDERFATEEPVACTQDGDCGADGFCRESACVVATPCDPDHPCLYGQSCGADGYCAQDGARLEEPKTRARSHTLVFYRDEQSVARAFPLVDNDLGALNPSKVAVRLVNLVPGSPAVDLTDEAGQFLLTGVKYQGRGFALVAPGFSHFHVKAGGQDLGAVTYVNMKAGENHLFVYVGGGRLVHAQTAWAPQGLRLVSALEEPVDVAVNAALRVQGLGFGQVSPHALVSAGQQRVTVVPSGERTDVTCYRYNGKGYCVGWKGAGDDGQLREQAAIIKQREQPIFLACENVYTGDACTDQDHSRAWGDPGRTQQLNDCRYAFVDPRTGVKDNLCRRFVKNPFDIKKHGDTRYSFMYWVGEHQPAGPLGYGPHSADPDTGEVFQGCANIYGASMLTYARWAKDLLDMLNGKLQMEDWISAQFIQDYVAAHQEDASTTESLGAALQSGQPISRQYSASDLALIERLRHRTPDPLGAAAQVHSPAEGLEDAWNGHATQAMQRLSDPRLLHDLNRQEVGTPLSNPETAKFGKIKGTLIEEILATNELKLALNEDALVDGTLGGLEQAGTEGLGDQSSVEWLLNRSVERERERMARLTKDCVYLSEFLDDSVVGTAMLLGCNLPDQEVPTQDLYDPDLGRADKNGGVCPSGQRCTCLDGDDLVWGYGARMFGGTLEHEVGHTIGLRHNFNASNDAFNYMPEYYQVRQRHYVPCPGEGFCEAEQECSLGCSSDADCFVEHTCEEVKDPETGVPGKQCVDTRGAVWGVCAHAVGADVPCLDQGDCAAAGGTCVDGLCVGLSQRACSGLDQPCDEGQVCDGGLCKVLSAAGTLSLPRVNVKATAPVRFKTYIPMTGVTRDEQIGLRTEFQYSSLMDYGGRSNFDVRGPGLYDRAAIKMGYGQLVEVYSRTDIPRRYVRTFAGGGNDFEYAFLMSPDMLKYAGGFLSYWHPFFFLTSVLGGPAYNYDRVTVPYYRVKFDNEMANSFNRRELDWTYLRVPYHFMGDEWRGNTGTYYFDIGVDMGEIAYHAFNELHDYYIFDAFKHEAMDRYRHGRITGYISRILDRWLPPLKDCGMSFAFAAQYLGRYSDWQTWPHMRLRGWERANAARNSFRYLAALLASPAPGSYKQEVTAEGQTLFRNFSPFQGATGTELNVAMGDGKFPYTTYWMDDGNGKRLDMGYYFFEHPLFVGSYWEKYAALMTLTDSTANFLSDYVGESLSVGVGTSIGFNTVFQTEMTNLLGGVIADDLGQFAGHVVQTEVGPRYTPPDPLSLDGGVGLGLVEPSIRNLALRTEAALFGIVYMPAAFNTSFIDSLTVFLQGSGDEYTLYDDPSYGVEKGTFTDPFGMKTYIAYKPNFAQGRIAPAFELVTKAQAAADAWEAEADGPGKEELAQVIREYIRTLDMLRALHEVFGVIQY